MKKLLIGFLVLLLTVSVLFTCVACEKKAGSDESLTEPVSDSIAFRKSASAGNSVQKVILTTDRMMVYRVELALSTPDHAETAASIRDALAKAEGYEQSSYSSDSGVYSFTLRVPTAKLNPFLEKVGEMGTVEEQTVTGEDITDRYVSAEQERDALLAKKAALEALAEEAATFNEKVTIYEKIQDVAAQIDSYESRLSGYRKSSEYSTVTITLYEEGTYEEPTFWERLGETFLGSGKSIGSVFGWILTAIVAIIPYAALLAALFGLYALIRLIVCRVKKVPFTLFPSKAKRAARRAKAEAALVALRQSTAPSAKEGTEKEEKKE